MSRWRYSQIFSHTFVRSVKGAFPGTQKRRQTAFVSIDGTEIASKDDLGTLMQKHAAGDTLSITIAREGQMQTVNVTLGEKTASNS